MERRAADVQKLLADAKLMAGYAARVGCLPKADVLATISRLESMSPSHDGYSKAVGDLTLTVNTLAQRISPTKLSDLRADWLWFTDHRFDSAKRIFLSALSAALIVIIGYFTYIHAQAVGIYSELSKIQSEDLYSKSEQLYNHALRIVYSSSSPAQNLNTEAIDYFQEYNEVHRLQERLERYTNGASTLFCDNGVVLIRSIERSAIGRQKPKDYASMDSSCNQLSGNGDNDKYYKQQDHLVDRKYVPADLFDETSMHYKRMSEDLQKIGIIFIPPQQRASPGQIDDKIRKCKNLASALGVWILPATYALLGSILFELYSMMKPVPPTRNLIVSRAALAMMAGVSISWIFASFIAHNSGDPLGGITTFGLAFLFGYSIDVFFAILDRTVASISQTVAGRA